MSIAPLKGQQRSSMASDPSPARPLSLSLPPTLARPLARSCPVLESAAPAALRHPSPSQSRNPNRSLHSRNLSPW